MSRLALPNRCEHISHRTTVINSLDSILAPYGVIYGHDHPKHCSNLRDLMARHILVENWWCEDLTHVSASANDGEHTRMTLLNA